VTATASVHHALCISYSLESGGSADLDPQQGDIVVGEAATGVCAHGGEHIPFHIV